MKDILAVVIALVGVVMFIATYGTASESLAWILAFTGWFAVAVLQAEIRSKKKE